MPTYCALTLSRILRPHTVTYSLPWAAQYSGPVQWPKSDKQAKAFIDYRTVLYTPTRRKSNGNHMLLLNTESSGAMHRESATS